MSGRYKLLVFDWDGTLADSATRIVAAARAAFVDLSLRPPDEAAVRGIIGLSLEEALKVLVPGADGALSARFVDHYRRHFLAASPQATNLFPGVRTTLRTLQERDYALAVATGKSRAGLDRELQVTGLRPMFAASRCADETCSKPHPQMLEELMGELGVGPGETVMIGDTDYDLQMARNAGVNAVGVSYGAHERERLLQCAPAALLHAIADLVSWLELESVSPSGAKD